MTPTTSIAELAPALETVPIGWATALYVIIGIGLVAYSLTGGADLGAGLWTLLASGPRKEEQQKAARLAIAPIWEANHVWLIFVIVVMFSAFPRAFATISIALHIPVALALVGLVFRGAAYSFHAYGIQAERTRAYWAHVFTWSSLITPFFLGSVIGALGSGAIRVQGGQVTTGFVAGWTTPFALAVGLFALGLFGLLAAVYLAAETSGELSEDFRRRALAMEIVAAVLAAGVFLLAIRHAPELSLGLARSPFTWPVQLATASAALATLVLLYKRRYRIARFTVAMQVGLVILGWGAAMDRRFVMPDISIMNAGSQGSVLPYLVLALGCGTLLLGPALWYLYRVFKL
jgi:cytochrome d ubiquinol oxidase subunit II